MENLNDCCTSLGPAVSVENVEREICESPVKSTAETGYEVDQSDSQQSNSSVAVSLYPRLVSASSSEARQNADELPFHQQEITLNDTESSMIQHDSTDCKQFEGAVGQGLSVPRNEVNNDVYDESVENLAGTNREEILYFDPIPAGSSQSELQPVDEPRRPARVAARPSRFRDDQFETQFHPGPRKNKVQQMHFNPGKGESLADKNPLQPHEYPLHAKQKTPERQRCQTLGKGESNGPKLGNSSHLTKHRTFA